MTEKPILHDLVRNNPATPEGKYLVKRRDGSVVEWPSFVLGARDPAAPLALMAYADAAQHLGSCHPDMCVAIRRLAEEFVDYRLKHGDGDPGRGLHRKDDPKIVAEMRTGHSA